MSKSLAKSSKRKKEKFDASQQKLDHFFSPPRQLTGHKRTATTEISSPAKRTRTEPTGNKSNDTKENDQKLKLTTLTSPSKNTPKSTETPQTKYPFPRISFNSNSKLPALPRTDSKGDEPVVKEAGNLLRNTKSDFKDNSPKKQISTSVSSTPKYEKPKITSESSSETQSPNSLASTPKTSNLKPPLVLPFMDIKSNSVLASGFLDEDLEKLKSQRNGTKTYSKMRREPAPNDEKLETMMNELKKIKKARKFKKKEDGKLVNKEERLDVEEMGWSIKEEKKKIESEDKVSNKKIKEKMITVEKSEEGVETPKKREIVQEDVEATKEFLEDLDF